MWRVYLWEGGVKIMSRGRPALKIFQGFQYFGILFLLAEAIFLPGASAQAAAPGTAQLIPKIDFVKKIWDRAPHNAFTDLVHFKGYWYCVFRESNSHHTKDGYGVIKVIRSKDTDSWKEVLVLKDTVQDLRDPKITVTPKGSLMLNYTGSKVLDTVTDDMSWSQQFNSKVCFSKDGLKWTRPRNLTIQNEAVWRVTWYRDSAYTVGWHRKTGTNLYSSRDGIHYRQLCHLPLNGFPNEASLVFVKNKMYAIVRREEKPNTVYIGNSLPPYKSWKFAHTSIYACGPNAIMLPDSSIAVCYRAYDNSQGKLFLGEIKDDKLNRTLQLPAGGDCGYAGMCWYEKALWLSFYSSHEGRTSIYLARVKWQSEGYATP